VSMFYRYQRNLRRHCRWQGVFSNTEHKLWSRDISVLGRTRFIFHLWNPRLHRV
jgi:hypothetical protein